MYDYNDKSAAIKEIQRFLSIISQKDESIPHVTVDGHFSEETRLAVTEFQRLNSLDATGTVDKLTFDLLYEIYTGIMLEYGVADENFDLKAFPLKIGQSGSDVAQLNTVLTELEAFYKELIKIDGDFFGADTEYSVKEMQRHLLEDETGYVDNVFFNRLKKELKIRQKFSNTK